MPKRRKPKVDWVCRKDFAGAWTCMGVRNSKTTMVSMQTDGIVNIISKKVNCDKASIMSSQVMMCGSEVVAK